MTKTEKPSSIDKLYKPEITPLTRFSGTLIARTFLNAASLGLDIKGKEKLDETKPPFIIAAAPHMAWSESLVPLSLLGPKRWAITMTKEENLLREDGTVKPFGRLLSFFGYFPVNRGEADLKALKSVKDTLANSGIVVIFPEGTRGREGERLKLKPAKNGASYGAVSLKNPVPIIPMAIWGQTEDILPLMDEEKINWGKELKTLRRKPIHVRIGEPIIPILPEDARRGERRNVLLNEITQRTMLAIRDMLPVEYHGYYQEK